MKIKRRQVQERFLTFDDNFASLINIDSDGSFLYEFRFFSASLRAIRNDAITVRMTVRSSYAETATDLFRGFKQTNDPSDVIESILTHEARLKDTKRNNAFSNIISTNVDITAGVNNFAIKSDSLGKQRIVQLKSRDELSKMNVDPPIMQTADAVVTQTSSRMIQNASHSLILKSKVDPSIAGTRTSNITGAHSAFQGIKKHNAKSSINDTTTLALQSDMIVSSMRNDAVQQYVSKDDVGGTSAIPVIADVDVVKTLNFRRLSVPARSVGYEDFFVMFELVTIRGEILEVNTKRVTHNAFVRMFNTPRVPPIAAVSPAQFPGKNVIEIQQNDEKATKVRIMRKIIKRPGALMHDTAYEHAGDVSVKKADGNVKYFDIVNNSSIVQYRIVPIGPTGILCSEFTNVIAPPVSRPKDVNKEDRQTYAALNTRIIQGAIEISISAVPPSVISAKIVRKDLTLKETAFTALNIDEPIKLVVQGLDSAIFVDDDVKDGHIYEYSCMLYYNDGVSLLSSSTLLQKYVSLRVGGIEIDIDNVEIVRDSAFLDVRFNVKSRVVDGSLNVVLQTLKAQGLDDIFTSELIADRERFQGLVVHKISRHNITTGEREDFGVVSVANFSDAIAGKTNLVKPLQEGHRYKYYITTLLRQAETMFDTFAKSETDASSGKQYTYFPAFARHPIRLKTGTVVSRESLKMNHTEDDFSFGETGNIKELDVTIETSLPKIRDATVVRVDKQTASVRWTIDGNANKIEHFVIAKEKLGQTTIAGKCHGISPQGKAYEFFDWIEPDDIGDVTYTVIPVFNNYMRGISASTGKLRVNDIRSNLGA